MTTIRAEIIGSNRCKAEGITVRAAAPVLEMCRALIAAGYDPNRPLNAYRGKVLALRICPIGDGAKYTVQGVQLRPYEAPPRLTGASLVRQTDRAATWPST